jgi:rhodanese-related sulfurtransferase
LPKHVDTADVEALVEKGAQLVEVLPAESYATEHLPGARNIPMAKLDARTIAQLDPSRPVVVYCYDHECDLSARAAHLIEAFGLTDVYDYATSKVAWMAQGLPVEGNKPASSRAGAIARPVATCALSQTVGDLRDRFTGDADLCVVTDDADVVLGVVRSDVRHLPADTPIAEVLQPAAPTVRPSITAAELSESMRRDDRTYVLVTHFDGVLVGIIERPDLYGQH